MSFVDARLFSKLDPAFEEGSNVFVLEQSWLVNHPVLDPPAKTGAMPIAARIEKA